MRRIKLETSRPTGADCAVYWYDSSSLSCSEKFVWTRGLFTALTQIKSGVGEPIELQRYILECLTFRKIDRSQVDQQWLQTSIEGRGYSSDNWHHQTNKYRYWDELRCRILVKSFSFDFRCQQKITSGFLSAVVENKFMGFFTSTFSCVRSKQIHFSVHVLLLQASQIFSLNCCRKPQTASLFACHMSEAYGQQLLRRNTLQRIVTQCSVA